MIYLKIQLTPIQGMPPLMSMPQALTESLNHRLWQEPTIRSFLTSRGTQAKSKLIRTEYIVKCSPDVVDRIPQKRISRPWDQSKSL